VSEEKDACLPPEHFENSTLMMVREAWVISAQMRGNLCTRFFSGLRRSVAEQKKKKRKRKDQCHCGLTFAHLHINNQCVALFSSTEAIRVSKISAGF